MEEKTDNIDILEEKEKRALENVKSLLLYSSEHEYFSPFKEEEIDDMNIVLNLVSNLIAENKELKEENEGLKTKLDTLIEKYKELKEMLKHRIEYTNILEKDLFENASNYVIPKSKVKEVIKELETMYDGLSKNPKEHLHSKTEYKIVIGVLQELLDERSNTDER